MSKIFSFLFGWLKRDKWSIPKMVDIKPAISKIETVEPLAIKPNPIRESITPQYKLGKRSLGRLRGVHPDLVAVVKRAIEVSKADFTVGEGSRTMATQKRYVRIGASKTLDSRHVPENNECNLSCAVDIWALNDTDGDGDLDINWVMENYFPLADAMKLAAKELNIPLEWGYDLWGWDGPHFQLPKRLYP